MESPGPDMLKILAKLEESSSEFPAQPPKSEVATLFETELAHERAQVEEVANEMYALAGEAGIPLLGPTDLYPPITDDTTPLIQFMRRPEVQGLRAYFGACQSKLAYRWHDAMEDKIVIPGSRAIEELALAQGVDLDKIKQNPLARSLRLATPGMYHHSTVANVHLPFITRLINNAHGNAPEEALKLLDSYRRLVEHAGQVQVFDPLNTPDMTDQGVDGKLDLINTFNRTFPLNTHVFVIPHKSLPNRNIALLEPSLAIPLTA